MWYAGLAGSSWWRNQRRCCAKESGRAPSRETGTSGGAQEHLFGLVSRLHPDRFDVSIVALSTGSAVRKMQRAGFDVLVIDEPDDAMVRDCAAELLNVTAGQAKTLLYGTPHHFTFATPTALPVGAAGGAGVGYDSECGAFSLRVLPATVTTTGG